MPRTSGACANPKHIVRIEHRVFPCLFVFLSGKYITKIYIIKYEQYVNRFIIIMKYVLCTQITFTFLLYQTLWIQKPHNHSQLMAPRSLINSLSSLKSSLAVQLLEHQKKGLNVTLTSSFSFPSSVG